MIKAVTSNGVLIYLLVYYLVYAYILSRKKERKVIRSGVFTEAVINL